MFEMMRALRNNTDSRSRNRFPGNVRGFSLVEMIVVVAIGTIMTIIAIPSVASGVRGYRLRGAVSSVTWAIQSTRYQALMEGYPFQVAFNSTTNAYLIQSMKPPAVAFSNVDTSPSPAVPFSSAPVVLSANTTLNFKPNGYVTAPVGTLVFTITYQGVCQKLSVTNYGNVSITPANPQPTCP
jgi:prepilin-type N-terminal cleavage/methylation domain-containing protein